MLRVQPHPRSVRRASHRGQTLAEYALILAFISMVAIFVMQSLGTKVLQTFEFISENVSEVLEEEDPTGGAGGGGGDDPTGGGNAPPDDFVP